LSVIGGGEHDIGPFNKNIQPITMTESTELDKSDDCTACEAFISVFDDHLINNTIEINKLNLIDLCDQVKTLHKDQVNMK